jgi:hypothetical protein
MTTPATSKVAVLTLTPWAMQQQTEMTYEPRGQGKYLVFLTHDQYL